MQIIRRLYLYAVSFVSLIAVLWGAIGLTRSIFGGEQVGGNVERLAGALSLILVGVPVFILHWWLAQRNAMQEPEEGSSYIRAIFLYGILLVTLTPAVQNLLALFSRSLVIVFGATPTTAYLGGDQTLSDNLVAIILNGLIAAYFYTVVVADWNAAPSGDPYPEVRRLYRYVWMLYGLGMMIFGAQQVFQYLLAIWDALGSGTIAILANGIALLLVGTPVWVFTWRRIQHSLVNEADAQSLLRLGVLYLVVFISVGVVLVSSGNIIDVFLRWLLGETMSIGSILLEISDPVAYAIPFGVVWAYYGRILSAEMNAQPDAPRRAGLRRLYYYILSLFGLLAAFIGIQLLLSNLIDIAISQRTVWGNALRDNLAAAIAALLVGLPLWVIAWRPMVGEASVEGEIGDHARRSLVRKGYLYLVLFAGVMGVMFSAGALLFELLSALLGDPAENLLLEVLQLLSVMALFVILSVYHWQAIRGDNRLAGQSLAKLHAQFPVLILAPEEGDFAASIARALQHESINLPVAIHPVGEGAPDETLSAAKAVILPASLMSKPSEALRLWLGGFQGEKLVVPTPDQGWHWIFGSGRSSASLERQTTRIIRHLAEGEELPQPRQTSAWMIIIYIVAGLIVLSIATSLVGVISSMVR
jgi:hypothetical protein